MARRPAAWNKFDFKGAPTMPPGPHKALKLYADVNIPSPLLNELRAAGLEIRSAHKHGMDARPDESIYQEARQLGRVLLTMDRDFWDDAKHPLHLTSGIIFADISPADPGEATDALARFYAIFAKRFPLNWWRGVKCRVSESGFVIRMRTHQGQVTEDEFEIPEHGEIRTRALR